MQIPALSFCMIVRNGAATLSSCLDSVASLADELIVVDTGSTDDSQEIARSRGARVVSEPWQGDFAAARNAYLALARGRWVLSLDADELLDPVDKVKLLQQLERWPDTAFVMSIRNYYASPVESQLLQPGRAVKDVLPGISYSVSRTVRLFPRRPRVTYSYPVHESLLPSLRREGIAVRPCRLVIHHMGYLYGWRDLDEKARVYGTLGAKKLAAHADYFLAHLELGKVRLREGALEEAERLFTSCLRLNPRCSRAYYYLAIIDLQRGHHHAALAHAQRAHAMTPDQDDVRRLVEQLHAC